MSTSNEPFGSGHPQFVPDGDLTAFHSYRMEWFPNRVRWLIDGRLVRTDTVHVPQAALTLHINICAGFNLA
jgi:beta-glucanase (GH16 family)